MIYLLWAIINIGVLFIFIATCFKATKLLREKAGLFAAVIFVLVLLSFIANPQADNGDTKPNSNQTKTWEFVTADSLESNTSHLLTTPLEKTLISTYNLYIQLGKDKQGIKNIPISASSFTSGFISGTNWKPISIIINTTNDNNKFMYAVEGVVKWNLLGATIYSQPKAYKGIVLIK